MKKVSFIRETLLCGLMTLVLDIGYLTADRVRAEDSFKVLSIDDIEANSSHEGVEEHGCRLCRKGFRGSHAPSFLSYYSGESQNIAPGSSALLAFSTSQTANNTITPSASGDAPVGTVDTFTVKTSGIYLITWNVSVTTGNNVSATLDLLINGTAINSPFETLGYGGGGGGAITGAVSGSFIVNVNATQTIQLKVSANVGEISANSPSISIMRVADIP